MVILAGFKPRIHYVDQIAEKSLSSSTYNNHKFAFNIDVYSDILDYLRTCLWYSAKCTSEPGSENETHLLSDFIKQLNESGIIEHV